ncbi:MAG: D-glycero-beta-D-manno-heptose-7-phosphate kinase [Spirochaetia bacterium]|nr:D-glycero-beta-D-manno-heptose-7-phosphate kinase [Spirochaetia bacterium]
METLRNKSPQILVVGDLMIDHYLWGSCSRISPEAPVQVVDVVKETFVLGGAGNVVRNLKALGAVVHVAAVIGNDENGMQLISMLKDLSVETSGVAIEKGRKTSKKSRIIAAHQQMIRFDRESRGDISSESQDLVLNRVQKAIKSVDAIILSDYGKGNLTTGLTQAIIQAAKKENKKVFIDPKGSDYSKYKGACLLTPNRKEASEATGIDIVDDKTLLAAGLKLKQMCDLEFGLITLSEEGMAVFDKEMQKISTLAKEVYDVTGAGDTVIAALAFALACNLDIGKAVRFANAAAAVVVGKLGSATANMDEIDEYEFSTHHRNTDDRIKTLQEIILVLKNIHREEKKVVFTNGCFDILHVGHIKYLEIAKSFGDILVVGLNSDSSVKRLKGNDRPINDELDRACLLAALDVVDYVVVFNEDDPYELIQAIQPDVLVKGGDYKNKQVIGSDIVKEVKIVEFIEGKSTSATIARIKHDLKTK